MEGDIPFEIPSEDTFSAKLTISPGGVPVDWTAGYSMDGQIRLDPSDEATASFTFSPDFSVPATGITNVQLGTAGLALGVYSYSLRLIYPSGAVKTVMQGLFTIKESATTTGGGPAPAPVVSGSEASADVVWDITQASAGNRVQTWAEVMQLIHKSHVPLRIGAKGPRATLPSNVPSCNQPPLATSQDVTNGLAAATPGGGIGWLMNHSPFFGVQYADPSYGTIDAADGVQFIDSGGMQNGIQVRCFPSAAGHNLPTFVFTGEPNDHNAAYFNIKDNSTLVHWGSRALVDWSTVASAAFRLDVSNSIVGIFGSGPFVDIKASNCFVYLNDTADTTGGAMFPGWITGVSGSFLYVFTDGTFLMPPNATPGMLGTTNYFPTSGNWGGSRALRDLVFPLGWMTWFNTSTGVMNFWTNTGSTGWSLVDGTPA